jgi:hypothetical protein
VAVTRVSGITPLLEITAMPEAMGVAGTADMAAVAGNAV